MLRNLCWLMCSFSLFMACQADKAPVQEEHPAPVQENRFEGEIQAYEALDKEQMPAVGNILFVGSSSIAKWRSLEQDMAPLKVMNRGFGGSTFLDLHHFADRIVFPYQPNAVVVYEGDNDIVAPEMKPEDVVAHLKRFQERMAEKLPGIPTYFISVKPSISRKHLLEKCLVTNQLVRLLAEQDHMLHYLDVANPMILENGRINPDIFIQDSLHMNAKGYEIWTAVIKPVLMQDFQE